MAVPSGAGRRIKVTHLALHASTEPREGKRLHSGAERGQDRVRIRVERLHLKFGPRKCHFASLQQHSFWRGVELIQV